MPASPTVFEILASRLRCAETPAEVDALLDQWTAMRTRATEWDAALWGFDPYRWCKRERAELARRARRERGPVPVDHEGTTL